MKTITVIFALVGLVALGLNGCQSMYVTSAKVYLQQNDLESAREQLELGLKENPNDAEAHFLLGKIYAQRREYSEMLSEFNMALSISEKNKDEIESVKKKHFRDLYNGAVEDFNSGKLDKAITELQNAVMLEPDDQAGWALLGKSYVRQEQNEEAIAALEKAVSLDPKFEQVEDRVLLMEIYYNTEHYEEALNSATEILRQDPANKDAIRISAFCYNALGQTEKALEYYQDILKDQPDDPDLNFNLGLLYEKMARYDDAVAQFDKTIQLNPEDLEAILHCAQLYLEMKGDNLKAIEYYKMGLEVDPDNAGILNNLGVAQIRAGEEMDDQNLINEGTASIKRAAELKGQNP